MVDDHPTTGSARSWRFVRWPLAGLLLAGLLFLVADREADRQKRMRLEAFRAQVYDLARISESIIEAELRSLDETLLVLRAAYAADPGRFAESVRLLRNGPLANPELLVVVVDRDGRMVFTDTPGAKPGLSLGDRRYFGFFAEGGKDGLYIDEPSLGRVTRRYTLPVVRPICDARGGFSGVVAISLPQHTLVNFIPKLRLSGETSIAVINHGGAVIHQSPAAGAREASLPPELLAQLVRGTEGVFSSRAAPDGLERIIAYRHIHIGTTPLIVYVSASPAAVLQETSLERGVLLGGAGFASLAILILILSYLKGRTLTERLIEALRSSKRREYETLTRTTLDGFCVGDGSGRMLDVNDTFCAMLGYTREELLQLGVTDVEADRAAGPLVARTPALVRNGCDRLVSRLRRKDGAVIDVELSVQQVGGGGDRFFAFFRDITERKRAEAEHLAHVGFLENLERIDQAIRRAESVESILTDVLDAALAIFACDRAWLVHPCDPDAPTWRVRMEKTRPEYPGALAADVDLPMTPEVRQSFRELLDANAPVVYDPRSGRPLPEVSRRFAVQSQIQTAVYPKTGKPWIFGLHQCSQARAWSEADVRLFTEIARRLADGLGIMLVLKELQQSEAHLRTLVQAIPDLIWLKDPDGVYLDCNPMFERFFGAKKKEIVGKTDYDFVDKELADFFRAHDRKAMAAGRSSVNEEWITFADDGHRALLETIKTPIYAAGGRLVGVLGIARDMTDRLRSAEEKARLEEQLRQSQKVEAIGRLAGGVAHDFNTLTAIVLGYGELLLGELPPGDPRRRHAEQIVEAGRRSSALTRQLLAFSRKQTLQPEVLDLNALLRNFESMLARLLGEGIELTFDLAEDPGRIKADPGQIEQIVTNLAVNARDAMPLGGSLKIATASAEFDEPRPTGHEDVLPGRYVLLSLTDSGCGMDAATMGRLFEPFFTTKAMGKGTGLGLATVYGIVKQSGGYIWASSEREAGTTFTICLPRTDALPEAKAVEVGEESPRGRGERILLVEDEASLRELCETLLGRLGYAVVAARNGPEALQVVWERGFEPDLVLTDVIMPGMSGAEMVRLLGKGRPGLRVLYMSGYPDEAIAPHGILDPGTAFLPKPFTERALAVKVRGALGGKGGRPGRRVLMIDDDAQFRDLVRHFCTKSGHVFAGAASAEEALAALAAQPFDVLLVDLNIPGTSGQEVLRRIRAAGHAEPAVVLTGDLAAAEMPVLRPLGAVLALEKSSRSEPLLQAIEAAAAGEAGARDGRREI